MTEDTLFSRIAAGEEPSYTIYEDETTYAFLDINPVAPGHTLVIPREPYEHLQDVPPEVAADLTATIQTLIPAIETAVGADATTVILSNGEASGQEFPHAHWHIVPQFEGEESVVEFHSLLFSELDEELDESGMADVAAAIRAEQ
jgi:histidine triad (HIT) family protein